jgi:penicillin-binding protein 1A
MVSMMKDVVQRGTAAGSVGSRFHVPSGGKTGTTNDGADVWYIGYTSDLVAGVWMGFDRPQKIKANAQGGELAAPAYTSFMTEVYRRRPASPDWLRPDGITTRDIDRTTGQLANPFCPPDVVITEYFIAGTEPVQECTEHSPFNMGQAFDTTGRPGAPRPGTPPPPGKAPRDTTNPFKIP